MSRWRVTECVRFVESVCVLQSVCVCASLTGSVCTCVYTLQRCQCVAMCLCFRISRYGSLRYDTIPRCELFEVRIVHISFFDKGEIGCDYVKEKKYDGTY